MSRMGALASSARVVTLATPVKAGRVTRAVANGMSRWIGPILEQITWISRFRTNTLMAYPSARGVSCPSLKTSYMDDSTGAYISWIT